MHRSNYHLAFGLAIVALAFSGCTHAQLRRNTVNQMATVHDLQQQQVLDNLAMFVSNRFAYPYYSIVMQGTSQLSDQGSLAIANGWGRSGLAFIFTSMGVNPSAQRQATEAWTINPVNDSVKLSLMRCTYQRAIEGCLGITPTACPNCEMLFEAFYMPPRGTVAPKQSIQQKHREAPGGTAVPPASVPWPGGPPNRQIPEPHQQDAEMNEGAPGSSNGGIQQLPHVDGIVTPYCLDFQKCWFCWGPKPPTHFFKCNMVGHHCGMYVWVPDEGRDELTKLTLLIQDIAFYEPPSSPDAGAAPGTGRMRTPYPYTVLGTLQILRAYSPPTGPGIP